MSISLVSSLLPAFLVETLQEAAPAMLEERKEKEMCAIALLVVRIVLGTIKALKQGNCKAFDANPGDGGCQNRAIILRHLFSKEINTEELETQIGGVKELLQLRNNREKERKKCSPQRFFQERLLPLMVSKDIEYLAHCYLSKVLRTPYETRSNGVIMTKSELSKLSQLSKNIDIVDGVARKKILEMHQQRLSQLSMENIRIFASEIVSLSLEQKERMVTMLSPEYTQFYSPDPAFEPKYFGSLLYTTQTVLFRLREEGGVVCVKNIRPPFRFFLEPLERGGEFALTDRPLPTETPLVVFEVVAQGDLGSAEEVLRRERFTDLVLAQAEREAANSEDFFEIDHLYFNTMGEECKL